MPPITEIHIEDGTLKELEDYMARAGIEKFGFDEAILSLLDHEREYVTIEGGIRKGK